MPRRQTKVAARCCEGTGRGLRLGEWKRIPGEKRSGRNGWKQAIVDGSTVAAENDDVVRRR
jgi:hypothetical protein